MCSTVVLLGPGMSYPSVMPHVTTRSVWSSSTNPELQTPCEPDLAPKMPERQKSVRRQLSITPSRGKDQQKTGGPSQSCNRKPTEEERAVRNVTFKATAQGRSIRHINDYPEDMRRACWITEEEFQEIREDAMQVLKLAEETSPNDTSTLMKEIGGFYGLEKHTKALKLQKEELRRRARGSVLEMQENRKRIEKLRGYCQNPIKPRRFDPENFAAKIYFLQSAKATTDAHVWARMLHEELVKEETSI